MVRKTNMKLTCCQAITFCAVAIVAQMSTTAICRSIELSQVENPKFVVLDSRSSAARTLSSFVVKKSLELHVDMPGLYTGNVYPLDLVPTNDLATLYSMNQGNEDLVLLLRKLKAVLNIAQDMFSSQEMGVAELAKDYIHMIDNLGSILKQNKINCASDKTLEISKKVGTHFFGDDITGLRYVIRLSSHFFPSIQLKSLS